YAHDVCQVGAQWTMWPKVCTKNDTVVGLIRFIEPGELFWIACPVKIAGVNNDATHHSSVTAYVFGGGMHHDVGAVLKWAKYAWWRQRRINNYRNTSIMGDFSNRREVKNIGLWVPEAFTKDCLGVGVNCIAPSIQIA